MYLSTINLRAKERAFSFNLYSHCHQFSIAFSLNIRINKHHTVELVKKNTTNDFFKFF